MEVHRRTFAELDVCPDCGGTFLDPGEGAAVHGAGAEATFLVQDGNARKIGPSALRCPAHDEPAAVMGLYRVGVGDDAIEIDHCAACGGVFLDAGEDVALLELAAHAERVIESRGGARFAAPPDAAHVDVVDAQREEGGKSLFGELVRGLLWGATRHRAHRRRHGHCDLDHLYDDWS